MTTGKLRWEVQPLVGFGPLLLGMTSAQVAAFDEQIGAVVFVDDMFGVRGEHRPYYTPSCSFQDDRLNSIDTNANERIGVLIDGIDVFATPPRALLAHLAEKNGGAALSHGAVVFAKLGIVTGGFYIDKEYRYYDPASREQDDRTLAVYDKDAFVRYIENIAPFALP